MLFYMLLFLLLYILAILTMYFGPQLLSFLFQEVILLFLFKLGFLLLHHIYQHNPGSSLINVVFKDAFFVPDLTAISKVLVDLFRSQMLTNNEILRLYLISST